MQSFAFPKILNYSSTELLSDHKATASNLKLLLLSDKNSLLGDPNYGTSLKKLFYEQGDSLLKDIIIDDILETIHRSMPQCLLTRKNITITTNRQEVNIHIEMLNLLDYQVDAFDISLTDYKED